MQNLKEMIQMKLQNRKRLRELRELCMVADGGGNSKGIWGGYVYTAIFTMDN